MTVFVGVEGGATRATTLVTAADGTALARQTGPPALLRISSPDAVAAELTRQTAAALASIGRVSAEAVCIAITGAGREAERTALAVALHGRIPAPTCRVVTDAEAALHDAFGTGPGIVLIAGTGSVAWARRPDGEFQRAGGWGPRFGDEGSGWAIGIAALRAIAHSADGLTPATRLTPIILDRLGLHDPAELIGWSDRAARADIAALAEAVLEVAEVDAAADAIIAAAAADLVRLVTTLAYGQANAAVAFAGGLLADGSNLRHRVRRKLSDGGGLKLLDRAVDGARGAAALACAFGAATREARPDGTTFET